MCIRDSLYGAAEMALSAPEDGTLDMLAISQNFGRLSALSMLLYFLVGPYVNIIMYQNAILPSITVPTIGIVLMISVIAFPSRFSLWSSLFAFYSVTVLFLTV